MTPFEYSIQAELFAWQRKMTAAPSRLSRFSQGIQTRINRAIPEKIHTAITAAIREMTKAVIFGASNLTSLPQARLEFDVRENLAKEKIVGMSRTAAAEGAITGAGGILLGLADFPIWLSLKMKMLFDLAGIYGYDVANYKERVYILHLFQMTFSSQENRIKTFEVINQWEHYSENLPNDVSAFDWRTFQQQYRDFIDIAKLLQLIPGIGAPVGAVVNHNLTKSLGVNAMNGYRLRWFRQNGHQI